MKKWIVAAFGILVAVGLALVIVPSIRDEIHWQWASHKDGTSSYESYVKDWPAGRHTSEARLRYDEHSWADAEAANTLQGYERYVQVIDKGKHLTEAKVKIESIHWQDATKSNTIRSYRYYVGMHPKGKFAQQAETKAIALRKDRTPYDAALRAGTEASLRAFLTDYPGHRKESEAQQAIKDITEGRDIVDLLKEKKVEVKTQGSGIQSVSVSMRKLVPYPLTARIPVGTYFVSANTSAQNMVTTEETKIRLDTNEWQDVSPDAACANRPRDIPGSDDRFNVQRSPNQAELARLMPILNKESAPFAVRQAAVWIVTDNADYDDLGILVSRSQFQLFGGTRQINEYEAARAMMICDRAGINIKEKAIWRDRQKIISGLQDADLKKWLIAKK